MVEQVQRKLKQAFGNLTFREDKHWYFVEKDFYPSVSSKIREHVVETDFEAILPHSAKKIYRETGEDISVADLRRRWQLINKTACDLGHETHDFLECYEGHQMPKTPQQIAGVNFLKWVTAQYDIVARELRMYSKRYRYAGTSDLLLMHRKTKELVIADYKTNGDLFKNFKGKTLKPPFDFFEENPFNEYQLQLSYYQIMLEEIGLKIDNRQVIYLQADGSYTLLDTYDLTEYLHKYLSNVA